MLRNIGLMSFVRETSVFYPPLSVHVVGSINCAIIGGGLLLLRGKYVLVQIRDIFFKYLLSTPKSVHSELIERL